MDFYDVCMVLGILFGIYLLLKCPRQGLTSKPSQAESVKLADEVISNAGLFNNGKLSIIKQTIPWLDAVHYEDIRRLIKNNKLNVDSVSDVLMR